MDKAVIEECTKLAFENKMTFAETVKRLAATGVERYHADLSRLEKTYYSISGGTTREAVPLSDAPAVGTQFS